MYAVKNYDFDRQNVIFSAKNFQEKCLKITFKNITSCDTLEVIEFRNFGKFMPFLGADGLGRLEPVRRHVWRGASGHE